MSGRSLRASTKAQRNNSSSSSDEVDDSSDGAPPAKRVKTSKAAATTSTSSDELTTNNPKSLSASKPKAKTSKSSTTGETKASGKTNDNLQSSPPTKPKAKQSKSTAADSSSSDEKKTTKNAKSSSSIKTKGKSSKSSPKTTLSITESTGDIFAAPAGTLLIHACNCEGAWGAGIALAFKKLYPAAYGVYEDHCDEHGHELLGSALLIPPQEETTGGKAKLKQKKQTRQHFVGCLFTSRSTGTKLDKADSVLKASDRAMRDLIRQVEEFNADADDGEDGNGEDGVKITEVRMCKINSGLFKVPWKDTRAAMEAIEVDENSVAKEVKVIERKT